MHIAKSTVGTMILTILSFAFPAWSATPLPTHPNEAQSQIPSLAPMLEGILPAVVNISASGKTQDMENPLMESPFFNDPFFRHFFGFPEMPQRREVRSLGSGVIINAEQGYILTNYHVIENTENITVTLYDEREVKAKVVGMDKLTDLAVLSIKADHLTALPMGDSDKLRVGDFVVAIGNPFGLRHTVTSGIVSALGRSNIRSGVDTYQGFIQTDASINPGNSGGALVNLSGELVGVNSAILSQSGGNIGIGFAVPTSIARSIIGQLVEFGEVRRGQLGVIIQDLTPDLAKALDVPKPVQGGVIVTQVVENSAADKADIKVEDIITSIDKHPVSSAMELRNQVGLKRIGDEIELEIWRDGKKKNIAAKLQKASQSALEEKQSIHPKLEGAALTDIPSSSPWQSQVKGIYVAHIEPGSPASLTGLSPGDVISSVNRHEVESLEDFQRHVNSNSKTLLLRIHRGRGTLFLLIK